MYIHKEITLDYPYVYLLHYPYVYLLLLLLLLLLGAWRPPARHAGDQNNFTMHTYLSLSLSLYIYIYMYIVIHIFYYVAPRGACRRKHPCLNRAAPRTFARTQATHFRDRCFRSSPKVSPALPWRAGNRLVEATPQAKIHNTNNENNDNDNNNSTVMMIIIIIIIASRSCGLRTSRRLSTPCRPGGA